MFPNKELVVSSQKSSQTNLIVPSRGVIRLGFKEQQYCTLPRLVHGDLGLTSAGSLTPGEKASLLLTKVGTGCTHQ